MAACAKVMESIMILDDDDETEEPSVSTLPPQATSCVTSTLKVQQSQSTHITESPFASAKKKSHILKIENEKLFGEFVDHCSAHTQEHPEVMTFLQTKYSKASSDFLMSVEFRNALGRCLMRAQANTTKTFVYINELCTMLKQHSAKRRAFIQPCNAKKQENNESSGTDEKVIKEDECTSKVVEEEERKTKKASRRQIAYLENLLKVYNDEIKRLQQRDLDLEDLEKEDSSYIQEHKLKRKIMKIYNKLCELKDCSTLTGRVLEQRITYTGSRYPEINKKIERFINRAEVLLNPPDYGDILQVVKRANERYSLVLSNKQQTQIAQDVFRETGNRLQERRHLDMVYNFGSHLTDLYKPTLDPALGDTVLAQKLRTNRTLALTNLEKVINTYANKQDDTEEEERRKRLEKERERKENGQQNATKEPEWDKCDQQQEEEEEEEEEEEDASSDPDIEEEIQASTAQVGPDDEDNEDNEDNDDNDEDKQLHSYDTDEPTNDGLSPSVNLFSHDAGESVDDSPLSVSETCVGDFTEMSLDGQRAIESPSSSEIPNQSVVIKSQSTMKTVASNCHFEAMPNSNSDVTNNVSTNQNTVPTPLTKLVGCSPSTLSPEVLKLTSSSKKRKRESKTNHRDDHLDMEMTCVRADSTQVDTPNQDLVSSSCSTPPPKKNKVNVATQCDPEEVIILSDSD
ncbi:death domain-associated protein 6 [Trichomycterus rosablanca]|uniref:death domain-associated protein 6 n=1 Tax=Trichomycterus rosablanca TaxID=2290929 RepID=UPI002F359614